ncbi:MAG: FHA domain-containing protein [Eubacterium sp.]|nr:FHA domain-containing protein [Eubacterium sp.]
MYVENYSDGNGKYVRITGDESEKMSDRIISKGLVQGVLPAAIQWIDGHREYVFETTGYVLIEEYISQTGIDKNDLIDIFRQICAAVNEVGEYLLDPAHLYIYPEGIYVRPDEKKIGLIYISEYTSGAKQDVALIAEEMLRTIGEGDEAVCGMIYRMHCFASQNDITWKDFEEFLDREQEVKTEVKSDEKTEIISKSDTVKLPKKPFALQSKNIRKKDMIKPVPLMTVCIGIIIPMILLKAGVFTDGLSGRVDMVTFVFSFIFFFFVSLYGAYRLADYKNEQSIFDTEDELRVCLIPEKRGVPVLPVRSFPYKIGRDKKRADAVIDDERISDVHAHIKREGNSVFLTDDESDGGTFLNDRRLAPWECVRINDGDEVRFYDMKYVVEILS